MHLHLLLPLPGRLSGPLAPRLPALQAMLGYGRHAAASMGDDEAWLCRFFGVAQQRDWPAAPFAVLGEGLPAQDGYWLRVQPVHLQLQRDRLLALDAAPGLSAAQAQQLVAALNTHFAEDGLCCHAPQAGRWYVRLDAVPDLQTTPLPAVLGRAIESMLPRGGDAMRWHARLNEMQMLLHEHPVNLALEQGGALPVNSLWLWGGGVLPAGLLPKSVQVWADSVLAHGLAQAHGADALPLPPSAHDWLVAAAPGQHLVVLDPASGADQAPAWMQLERDWFAPLLQALRRRRVSSLALHLAAADRVTSLHLQCRDAWKLWRRPRPLEAFHG